MRRRLGRAARVLDTMNPGWESRININRLNMASFTDCVLGQLYGHYHAPMANQVKDNITCCRMLFTNPFCGTLWTKGSNRRTVSMWVFEIQSRMTLEAEDAEIVAEAQTASCRLSEA